MLGKLIGKDSLVLNNTPWKHIGGLRMESHLHITDLDKILHRAVALNVCITVKEITCRIGGSVCYSSTISYCTKLSLLCCMVGQTICINENDLLFLHPLCNDLWFIVLKGTPQRV
jgi:hypothetical protein